VGNLFRRAEAFYSQFLNHAFGGAVIVQSLFGGDGFDAALEALGGDGAGIDGIDANAIGKSAMGQGFGEVEKSRIHRAANGEIRTPSAPTHPDDIDDGAMAGDEIRPSRAAESHGAEKLQRKAVGPVFIGQLEKITAFGRTGVVDEKVDGPESLDGGGDDFRGGLGFTEVGGMHQALSTARGGYFLKQVFRAGDQHEAHLFLGQGQRDGVSDTATGAGDDGDFVF